MNRLMLVALVVAAGTGAAVASDEPDLAMYARIREEGLSQSQVMDFAFELMDRIGARLSGSPNLDRAVAAAAVSPRGRTSGSDAGTCPAVRVLQPRSRRREDPRCAAGG